MDNLLGSEAKRTNTQNCELPLVNKPIASNCASDPDEH